MICAVSIAARFVSVPAARDGVRTLSPCRKRYWRREWSLPPPIPDIAQGRFPAECLPTPVRSGWDGFPPAMSPASSGASAHFVGDAPAPSFQRRSWTPRSKAELPSSGVPAQATPSFGQSRPDPMVCDSLNHAIPNFLFPCFRFLHNPHRIFPLPSD